MVGEKQIYSRRCHGSLFYNFYIGKHLTLQQSEEQAASSQSSGTENPSKDSNSTLSQNKSAKRKMNNDASTEKASKKVKSKSTKRNEDVGTSGPMSTSPEVTSKKSSIVNGRNVNDGNADKNDNEHDPMDDDKPDGAEDVTNEDKVAADSSSELSELIDEAPPTKRKKSRKSATEVKAGKDAITKSKSGKAIKSKRDADLSPQEAEIKRLQSWLVKCGIRKVWGKELAPYDTPRTKIQHLKEMLADAGMEGRYSAEKASRIREQRELKADLDAVQEGAKMWGQTEDLDERDSSSGGDRKANRGRRLARGLRHLDFLGSDDGEETD